MSTNSALLLLPGLNLMKCSVVFVYRDDIKIVRTYHREIDWLGEKVKQFILNKEIYLSLNLIVKNYFGNLLRTM